MSEKKSIKKVIKTSLIYLLKCMIIPFMVFMIYGMIAPILSISYELWLITWMPITTIISMSIFVFIEIYNSLHPVYFKYKKSKKENEKSE